MFVCNRKTRHQRFFGSMDMIYEYMDIYDTALLSPFSLTIKYCVVVDVISNNNNKMCEKKEKIRQVTIPIMTLRRQDV